MTAAIAEKMEVAQDTEDKAVVDVETTRNIGVCSGGPQQACRQHRHIIIAPVSGVITEQNVTNAAGVVARRDANLFTIRPLARLPVVRDVYENDLANVHVGDSAGSG